MSDDTTYDDAVRCSRCRKSIVQGRVSRYEHEDCDEPQIDPARQAEAIRRLHLSTARMLRKAGFAEEAAYHDTEAERGR
jgi:hypothetical protein